MRLTIFPMMGMALQDPKYSREYRRVRIGKAYLVFYEVLIDEKKSDFASNFGARAEL